LVASKQATFAAAVAPVSSLKGATFARDAAEETEEEVERGP